LSVLGTDVGRGLKSLSDSEFANEFGSKLRAAEIEMKKFGVTGTKVPAEIAAGLERLNSIDIAKFITQGNATAAAELEKIQKENERRVEEASKRTTEGMKRNFDARVEAASEAEDEIAKRTMSSYELQVREIQKADEKKKASLDKYAAGYAEAMSAIERETAEKMRSAADAHEVEIERMKADADSYSNRVTGVLGGIPNLLKQAFTGGGGFAGFGKALQVEIASNVGGKAVIRVHFRQVRAGYEGDFHEHVTPRE